MKIKKNYCIFLLLFITTVAFGQKQGYTWYFGNGVGLDFNTGCEPIVLTDGNISGYEGCSTISDNITGQLLFYTNSNTIWNRNHIAMPNSNLVNNGSTITQVISIQKPMSTSIYYIITSEIQGSSGEGLQFHEIDMTLNGGLGGLVSKNNLLYQSPVTEKITAVRHANGIDIWLIGHELNSNKFLSFLVTSAGINTTPIISQIGKIHSATGSNINAIGEMKASPNGLKLAVVTHELPDIELFDFDNSSGQINNVILLLENGGYDSIGSSGLYGISFSSNSTMLYVSKFISGTTPAQIIQYDISSNNANTINNSRVNVFSSTTKNIYSMQLAPNRKIYVGQNGGTSYLGVINSPDSYGLGCNYVDNGIFFNGSLTNWGLNNMMEYNNYCLPILGLDEEIKQKVNLYPNPANDFATISIDTQASYSLINIHGKTLQKGKLIIGDNSLNISQFSNGLYFIIITTNTSIASLKLIKD